MAKRKEAKSSLTQVRKEDQEFIVLTENVHILFDFSGDIPIMN
jgi:hypothetical protein